MWGTQKCLILFNCVSAVHPHACGELCVALLFCIFPSGSSPRVWGTPGIVFNPVRIIRFIPTRVGNSLRFYRYPVLASVHPHACGELALLFIFPAKIFGSSPRVWGTRPDVRMRYQLYRFIPTRVGNSQCSDHA